MAIHDAAATQGRRILTSCYRVTAVPTCAMSRHHCSMHRCENEREWRVLTHFALTHAHTARKS
jgi:hypothetical protein